MYKISQRVLVKSEQEIRETLDCGHCAVTGTYWNSEEMGKYCNRVVIVDSVESYHKGEATYLVRDDSQFWCFSQEWLKPAVELPKDLFEI